MNKPKHDLSLNEAERHQALDSLLCFRNIAVTLGSSTIEINQLKTPKENGLVVLIPFYTIAGTITKI